MDIRWHMAAYYGPGGRKGGKGRVGEREGDLAIQTWHLTETSLRMEVTAAESRKDIGRIDTWRGP